MLYEIKSWLDGRVLFSLECDSLKICLEAAVSAGTALNRARLDRARLDGASLVRARLDGASLDGASLDGARLDGARLVGARLDGARLVGASLNRARLNRARLNGIELRSSDDYFHLALPNGWPAYAYRTAKGPRIQVGCRNFALAEGRAYWANKDDRREVLAALDYAEAIGRIRSWEMAEVKEPA